MTKLTPEQAIELLRKHDTYIQTAKKVNRMPDDGHYFSIDNEQARQITPLLESLSREAEMGRE